MWGEPPSPCICIPCRQNFNSLAPCGANLHNRSYNNDNHGFQLTRPVWGEPRVRNRVRLSPKISTHSPRVGRTGSMSEAVQKPISDFNSLAPCGANPSFWTPSGVSLSFQLTRPVWGEPTIYSDLSTKKLISTHSPRVGRTCKRLQQIKI